MQLTIDRARPILERFKSQGTLGPGAERTPLDRVERFETNMGHNMVAKNFELMDNPAYDNDPKPGSYDISKEKFLDFQINQIREAQQAGDVPKEVNLEEVRSSLKADMGNMNGSLVGTQEVDPSGMARELALLDTANNSVEFLICLPFGSVDLEVKDAGNGKYSATVTNTIPKGESDGFKESFTGDWNVLK